MSTDGPPAAVDQTLRDAAREQKVSVIVANFNGAPFLTHAIGSACRQTHSNIEVIVVDDASTDNSISIVEKLRRHDQRVRLLTAERNSGPANARNRALAVATGEWISILDCDDVMHPDRLSFLLASAERDQADIVADDLLMFDRHHVDPPKSLLNGRWARAPFWPDAETYVRSNVLFGSGPALGYLKPMFRTAFLRSANVTYDERIRVAEDFDFVLRLLERGAKFRVYPRLLYFYRRHDASISHRLTREAIEAMQLVGREAQMRHRQADGRLKAALDARARSIDAALAFDWLVAAFKRRDLAEIGRVATACPRALLLLRYPIAARLKRRRSTVSAKEGETKPQVCVLARQRVVGRTNGSSVYLLSLVEALSQRGVDVHFLSPSPATLGRWPFLALRREMDIFRSVRVRGTWRLGRWLIATDPAAFLRGMLAAVERVLLRTGLISRQVLKSASYAVACPLTRKDQLFVARHVPLHGDRLIADYCFLTEAIPYALRPETQSAVIMHDLFSSRVSQFAALGTSDLGIAITEEQECALLGKADVIVAIQKEEAEFLRQRIPDRRIIVAPLAAKPVSAPQPGRGDRILFVGSSAAANVDGLSWFLHSCWPQLRRKQPKMLLRVGGTVCQKLGAPTDGVEFLGVVGDLTELYAEAGIVISPLRAGSGLKIKLIEALGHGKAVVATSVTLQGVVDELRDCVQVADHPEEFVSAILDLSADISTRSALAQQGLSAVAKYFSAEACYREFVDAMTDEGEGTTRSGRHRAAI